MNQNIRTALIIGGVIITAAIIIPLVAGNGWGGHDNHDGMMGGFGWMWLMPIIWILFLGLIIWGVAALVRGTTQPGGSDSPPSPPDSALEILKKRYARGDISKEEYEEKKRDLTERG